MISKKILVNTISETLNYLLVGRGFEVVSASPDILGSLPPNLGSPAGVKVLTELFEVALSLRPEVESPFRHWSLATQPKEPIGAHWEDISQEFYGAHGVRQDLHSFLTIRHLDRPHDHIHSLFCRVGSDGSLLRDTLRDCAISQMVCRTIEKRYGLEQLESSVPEKMPPDMDKQLHPPRLTRAEREMQKRGVLTHKEIARSRLDTAWPSEGETVP